MATVWWTRLQPVRQGQVERHRSGARVTTAQAFLLEVARSYFAGKCVKATHFVYFADRARSRTECLNLIV
jgi:hypothetical protein